MLEAGDSTVVHDPKLIAKHFGDYFSTVATTVVNTCGPDNISPYFIKVAAAIVSKPLSEFVNYSFAFGRFPDTLKHAKVVPVFKSGNKHVVTNYRPISLLSSFSKIFEKLLYQRLDTFIRKHSIISPFQYGFQAGHSTKHAVTNVITMAYDNINNKKFTGVSFLDIKKAFDRVDHHILINKLEHYGIRGTANDLLKSYLLQRKQFIVIDEQSSKSSSSSSSSFNPVFPCVRRWPDAPHSFSNRSHSLSPSRAICSSLHPQPNLFYILLDLFLPCLLRPSSLLWSHSLQTSLPSSKCYHHPS